MHLIMHGYVFNYSAILHMLLGLFYVLYPVEYALQLTPYSVICQITVVTLKISNQCRVESRGM